MPINVIIHQIATHQSWNKYDVSPTLPYSAITLEIATIWFEGKSKDNSEGDCNH